MQFLQLLDLVSFCLLHSVTSVISVAFVVLTFTVNGKIFFTDIFRQEHIELCHVSLKFLAVQH